MAAALALVSSNPTVTSTDAPPAAPRKRDRAERDALVKANLGLVHKIANDIHRHLARFVPTEDLVGFGSIGLIEAAERYDASGRLPFGAFARYRIRGAIFDGIRITGASQNGGLTYSRAAYKQIATEQRVNRLLEQEALTRYGEVSSPEKALAYIDDVLTRIARTHALYSVDLEDLGSDAGVEEIHSTGNKWSGRPLPAITEDTTLEAIRVRDALAVLTPKQRKLMDLVYGRDMDLNEAGRELGIQSGTVCKLHERAIAALRAVIAPETDR